MSTTFDLPAELSASLAGPAAAWRFVERFAAHLGAPVEEAHGCTEEELAAAEQRLGLPLPGALREAYGRFGRRFDLFGGQEQWIPLEDVEVEDGILVFMAERYWYWAVGIRLDQAGGDDPPLVTDATPGDPVDAEWEPMADRFSAAFVESVLNGNLLCDDMGGMRREAAPGDIDGSSPRCRPSRKGRRRTAAGGTRDRRYWCASTGRTPTSNSAGSASGPSTGRRSTGCVLPCGVTGPTP
ncbi:hypothetical protein ACIRST_07875 [Kitasatospora sp. NPDC101447]|uniref:hypothetical protein n=1 Tax=Kitasatospora sp. NPDC101447 TaxID=3364102 RepID=UPI00380AF87C